MKKLFIVTAILLVAGTCFANPFLVSDPQTGITLYKLTGPAWVVPSSPANLDGSLHLDVANSGIGENALTVAACSSDPMWGESCSDPVPFVFARPSLAKPSGVMNLRLIP